MAIPEPQLERWARHIEAQNAQYAHYSIRTALEEYTEWPNGVKYEVYLQGSYRNDTNIRGDSDVDLVVQLNSTFRNNLTDEQKRRFGFTAASYRWEDFRNDVLRALREYYGSDRVQEGKKSLKVRTSYLPADVVVCLQYRHYPSNPSDKNDFVEGMTFYVLAENRWVINYPKLHYKNGVKKNQSTDGKYKRTVRMFKNARTYLIERGKIPKDLAPSYFLECFLYNVPDSKYTGSFRDIFLNVLKWLIENHTKWSSFMCQNRQDPLFNSSPEQWSEDLAVKFIEAMVNLWENWG